MVDFQPAMLVYQRDYTTLHRSKLSSTSKVSLGAADGVSFSLGSAGEWRPLEIQVAQVAVQLGFSEKMKK